MSKRKVQKVMPISAAASSRQLEINQTSSILSDPNGRWISKRQGAINEAFEKRMCLESSRDGRAKFAPHDTQNRGAMADDTSSKLPAKAIESGELSGTRTLHLVSISDFL